MNGMVTHIATLECLVTQPHRAVDCAIVMARRQSQGGADLASRRREDEQGQPEEGVRWHGSHSSGS
jgi:hypothetical protein